MRNSEQRQNVDVLSLQRMLAIPLTSFSLPFREGQAVMPISWPWRKRKGPLDSTGLQEAIEARMRAAQKLARSEEQLRIEERTITAPLRRSRHEMLAHNHVADNIRRNILEEGGR